MEYVVNASNQHQASIKQTTKRDRNIKHISETEQNFYINSRSISKLNYPELSNQCMLCSLKIRVLFLPDYNIDIYSRLLQVQNH